MRLFRLEKWTRNEWFFSLLLVAVMLILVGGILKEWSVMISGVVLGLMCGFSC